MRCWLSVCYVMTNHSVFTLNTNALHTHTLTHFISFPSFFLIPCRRPENGGGALLAAVRFYGDAKPLHLLRWRDGMSLRMPHKIEVSKDGRVEIRVEGVCGDLWYAFAMVRKTAVRALGEWCDSFKFLNGGVLSFLLLLVFISANHSCHAIQNPAYAW
jgi:hypothetical protein